MKRFLKLGDDFAKQSNWKDFALTKFCLFAMGVVVGTNIPAKYQLSVCFIAAIVFVVTYIPLMSKILKIARANIGGK